MWFMLAIGLWLYVTPTRANSGKWRVLYGKVESGLMSDLEPPVNMFDYVPTHAGFMGSHKPSSFCNCLIRP
jgi:hypothetical protein